MTEMSPTKRQPVEKYLDAQYPFNVLADPDGGYVLVFPDLPGCLTQVESVDEIPVMAEEARRLWIKTAYDQGQDIPLPSYPEEYSGKFNLRLPRSLHRSLAEAAEQEGVSLNQYVVQLLARGDSQARLESRLEQVLANRGESAHSRLSFQGPRLLSARDRAYAGSRTFERGLGA
jgi:antitoxin HicB